MNFRVKIDKKFSLHCIIAGRTNKYSCQRASNFNCDKLVYSVVKMHAHTFYSLHWIYVHISFNRVPRSHVCLKQKGRYNKSAVLGPITLACTMEPP